MTLLSDSSMNMFPTNKQSEFTVKLDHPILIEEESWEVALVEICTPSEVLNITEENTTFSFWLFPISIVCTQNSVWKILQTRVATVTTTAINSSLNFQLEFTCHLNIWLKKSRPLLTDLKKVY